MSIGGFKKLDEELPVPIFFLRADRPFLMGCFMIYDPLGPVHDDFY